MNKLLLIGPSNRIKEKEKKYYENFKDKGYSIISYTGSVTYLSRLQAPFDYFSFIDPYTIYQHQTLFKECAGFFQKIKLLGFNLYENEMSLFYKYGLSSSSFIKHIAAEKKRLERAAARAAATRIPQQNNPISHTEYLQNIFKIFNTTQLYDPVTVPNILKLNEDYDFHSGPIFFSGYKKITNDKFLGVLLPLVFNLYNPIDHIHCIGFGDFNYRRCGGSSMGYKQYQRCSQFLAPIIQKHIKKSNIHITFEHEKKNFFYDLLIKKSL